MVFLNTFSNPRRIINQNKAAFFKIPVGVQHFFPGGGGGPNANFYRNL